jgi:hypothetical protein
MKKKPLILITGVALLLLLAGLSFRTRSAPPAVEDDALMEGAHANSLVNDVKTPLRNSIKLSTSDVSPDAPKTSLSNSPGARFERARICHEAAFNKRSFELQVKGCQGVDDTDYVAQCLARTAGFDKKIAAANQILAQCSPVPAEIEEDFYRTSIEAAKAGDATAQVCYLESDVNLHRPFTDEEVAYYHSVDAGYVNDALKRGDWRMVALMARTYRDPAHHSTMRSELTGGDPYTLYQMKRLLSLGAEGEYKELMDWDAGHAKAHLTPEQVQKADDWVAWIYEKHFASSPRLTERPTTCESSK